MEKISVQANRAQCAAHLIFYWIDGYLERASENEQHIESIQRVRMLARASLCSPSGDYPQVGTTPDLHGDTWPEMICLGFVHQKALMDGIDSDAHQWLGRLAGFRWDHPDQPQLETTLEQHGYHQMILHRIIDPAWRLAGVYCDDESPWRECGEHYVKAWAVNPCDERIDWSDIEKFNAQNRACIERDKLNVFVDRATKCQTRLVKSL